MGTPTPKEMVALAEVDLRASARNYAEALDTPEEDDAAHDLRRAAFQFAAQVEIYRDHAVRTTPPTDAKRLARAVDGISGSSRQIQSHQRRR